MELKQESDGWWWLDKGTFDRFGPFATEAEANEWRFHAKQCFAERRGDEHGNR